MALLSVSVKWITHFHCLLGLGRQMVQLFKASQPLQDTVSNLVLAGRCTRKAWDSPYTPCWQQVGVRWPGCGCDNPARRSCPGQRYGASGGTGAPPSQTGTTQLCSWVGPGPVWCWASLRPPLCGLSRGEGLPGPGCWPEEA